jgi:AcrR family transcriptional regulator
MNAPKWQRRSEERPRDICAAALEVFAEKGFAAARVDEIAKRAGVSKGTLYLYFEDKQAIFRAVVRETVVPNFEMVQQALLASNLSFADIVRMFLERFADLASRAPLGAIAKMVIGESRNFPELSKVWHDQVASRALGLLATLIADAQKRGEVRSGNPRFYAFSLAGPMLMGVLWKETLQPAGGAPLDLALLARQHAETVLAGMLSGSQE